MKYDAARPQLGQLRGDGERPAEVAGLDEDQAAEELLAVNERAIGQQRPVFLVTHCRRRAECVQADPAGHVRAGEADVADGGTPLRGGRAGRDAVGDDEPGNGASVDVDGASAGLSQ